MSLKQDWERIALEAKPCPFCGSKNIATMSRDGHKESKYRATSYIRCLNCGVQVYGDTVRGDDGEYKTDYDTVQHQVLKVWNRRAS